MRTTLFTATLALLLAGSPALAGDAAAPAPPPAPEQAITPASTPALTSGACHSAPPSFFQASEGDDLSPIFGWPCECLANSDCRPGGVCIDPEGCGRCCYTC